MNARGLGSRWKSRVMSFVMMLAILIFVVFLFIPSVQERVAKFLVKSASDDVGPVTTERITSSRMAKIDEALYNFHKSPIIGNGFQVSKDMKNMKENGLAILSAPIEKGVWVTAVLEEGGIIGFLIFTVFLFNCIIKSIKRKAYIGGACLFVVTVTNLGEFTFFSMSYAGGFSWAMVFVGLALDLRKMSDENEGLRKQMEFEQMQMEIQEGVL